MADINSTGGLRDLFASKLKETDFNGQRRVTAGLDDEKSGQDRVAITSVLFRTSSSQQYYLNIGAGIDSQVNNTQSKSLTRVMVPSLARTFQV